MTPIIHQNNLGTELFLFQILDLKVFRLEMHRIRLSNLFHSVGAAKLKDPSKNVLEQFLLSGGIIIVIICLTLCIPYSIDEVNLHHPFGQN